MSVDELTLFFQYVMLGFAMGTGLWLLAFAMRSLWNAFKSAINL